MFFVMLPYYILIVLGISLSVESIWLIANRDKTFHLYYVMLFCGLMTMITGSCHLLLQTIKELLKIIIKNV